MTQLADDIAGLGAKSKQVNVAISYEVVRLFSEQLYASPVKAIEELVVNSWDAGARVCSVLVDLERERRLIAVFDDGKGMTLEEMENLWHIGVSEKPKKQDGRKQIGKFGIGKLASYAVARRATYVSKTAEGLHGVSINFENFARAAEAGGNTKPVTLTLRKLANITELRSSEAFKAAETVLATGTKRQNLSSIPTWTLVVLEDLKDKAQQLMTGRLRWVLETAMPLESDFVLYCNGSRVESSKDQYEKAVAFTVGELPDQRIKDLEAVTKEQWTATEDGLSSKSFPSGVTGEVFVTKRSLYAAGGKSEDLGRSHGFFVRARNRLINETDPLFGARPLSFATWNHFAAIVEASDLHAFVTASRDDVEQTDVKAKLRELLIQLFNEARERYEAWERASAKDNGTKKEGFRDYVGTELVERPLADALVAEAAGPTSHMATGPVWWRYLAPIDDVSEIQKLVDQLYATERKDRRYSFKYSPAGASNPIARLDAGTASFFVNEDHPLVREFAEKPDSRRLLEAVIVCEALLEAYLHAAHVAPEVVSELLERRDTLLRSLAADESYSLRALATALRDASRNANDLEIALVGALRALGFSARHIGGSGTPDGFAEYVAHGVEEKKFTLEAKSSADVPSLPQLDFAGLRSHYEGLGARGCLLIAPSYPGADEAGGQVSQRSKQQGVSCWTIEQLARVVEAAERRHINARNIEDIVFESFTPLEVGAAVDRLLSNPSYDKLELYRAVIDALAQLEPRLRTTPRNISHLAAEISRSDKFVSADEPQIREAVIDLGRASSGMLYVNNDDQVFVIGSLDELRRRTANITNEGAPPRRRGTFRPDGPHEG